MSELKEQLYKTRPLTLTHVSAHQWLSRGFKLLPCQPGTKRLVKTFGPVAGRVLLAEDVEYWFRDRGANLAVVAPDQFVILDFDELKYYESFSAAWPDLAASYTESTPRGGRHVFLSLLEPGGLVVPGLVKGCELKRFCLVHPSQIGGVSYEILEPGPIRSVSTETVKAALEPFFVPGENIQPSPIAKPGGLPVPSWMTKNGLRQNTGIIARVQGSLADLGIPCNILSLDLRLDGRGEWLEAIVSLA